ncbi:TonB-dependent receptor domain-containing protein [Roseivirga sp. BDSF3-8]|uniref:TonB-dependent receptor n=1 Tax=Roseivirga sp. BDSF3-8 TaxID=3241598 RepID=UPI0035325A70
MKSIYLFLLLLALPCLAEAQVVTIQDSETGEPLEMVVLLSQNPRAFVTTNSRGQADISTFQGLEDIRISFIGYEGLTRSYQQLVADPLISLKQSSLDLDAVIVSGTRWNQVSSDIPSRITSITPREVALQNPQTAADLLGLSGEVFIQKSQQGGGSPMIRGFATNRLLYTVDGVRMNTAIFRGGNIQNVISLDPFAIENTEIFFGPGSVIYGSDAIGGVMSFQTIDAEFGVDGNTLVAGNAAARYATANNEMTGHLDLNIGLKKWAFVTSYTHTDYDDLRMGSNGPDDYLNPFYVERRNGTDVVIDNDDPEIQRPSGYSQDNFMQKVRFSPSKDWDLQYGFHYSQTSEYGRYDRHQRTRNGLPRYAEWNYGPQKWMMNNLSANHLAPTGMYDQITIRLAQQSFEESRISRNLNDPQREIRTEEVEAYSANLDLQKNLGDGHTLFYGAEYVLNDVTSTGVNENIETGTTTPGPARYPDASWASYGAYVTDEYQASDKVMLQAGLRYNRFSLDATFDDTFYPLPFTEAELHNGSLTGSLGTVYRPTDSWVLKASMATGFRSPNVDDVGKVFDSEPGAVVVPNPNLDAEYAYNAEISAAKVFGEFLKADVTVFHTWLENALVRRDFTLSGMDSIVYDGVLSKVQAIQNASVARVYGIQAGIEVQLSDNLRLTSDFNYQNGEEELDDGTTSPSRHAAPWFGVTRLSYNRGKLNLQAYALYNGTVEYDDLAREERGKTEIYALDDNGNPYAPGWYTLNLKALYRFSSHLSVSAGLENITDQRYRPYSSGLAGAGRNLILSVRGSF